jgi:cyanate lyase
LGIITVYCDRNISDGSIYRFYGVLNSSTTIKHVFIEQFGDAIEYFYCIIALFDEKTEIAIIRNGFNAT